MLATGSQFRYVLLVLVCLTTVRAWADDLSFAPAPPAQTSSPARPRQAAAAKPKPTAKAAPTATTPPTAKATPTATQAAYHSTLAYPASQSPPAASSEELPPQQPAAGRDPNGNVSPDEMFPMEQDGFYPDETIAPTLPARGCFQGQCVNGDDDNDDMAPPAGMTLNSGGWFSRGCWYSQEEAIFLMRSERGRFKRVLATEFDPSIVTSQAQTGTPPSALLPGTPTPTGTFTLGEIIYVQTVINVVAQPLEFSLPLISAQNTLLINPNLGFTPGARLTVGYRLGTDAMNRQSSIEFTFQGLSNWSVQNSITAQLPFENTLFTGFSPPPPVTSIPNNAPLTSALTNNAPGFTFTNFQQYTYNANLNSYEVNFKLAKRLGRDRTVLTREGIWARVVTPQFLPALYGGLRLIRYNEQFLWRAEGVDPSTIAGNYNIQTQNTLIGPQFGGNLTYHHENWKVTARLGGGALVNFANQRSNINGFDTYANAVINRFDTNNNANLSMLLDFGINSTYYFRPNMGFRFGYQIMAVSNLALAERQLTFLNLNPPIMNQDHGLYFQGVSTGFDFSW